MASRAQLRLLYPKIAILLAGRLLEEGVCPGLVRLPSINGSKQRPTQLHKGLKEQKMLLASVRLFISRSAFLLSASEVSLIARASIFPLFPITRSS